MDVQQYLQFALPDIREEEIAEVVDSLRSGWLTTGLKTKRFEEEFTAFIGDDCESVAVNSATAGLHLALEALGIGDGDEVITTPYTFTATAEVVRYLGADPIFVDIDAVTFNLDVSKIEAVITPRTRAIVPVHFAGLSCDMAAILAIAKQYNLKVVEDAAHAFPASYNGIMVGALQSDATVFSFYATKTITTGEGGMVVTRNPDIAARCRTMRLHGINKDVFDRHRSDKPNWYYEVVAPGFKYNMTDIAASIGIHQLRKAYSFRDYREKLSQTYSEAFEDMPVIPPPLAPAGCLHAWHLYVLRLKSDLDINRDQFIESMSAKGVGCSVHFIPLHTHPYWRDRYGLLPSDFPVAIAAYESAVSLPLYTKMTSDDCERVIDAVREVLEC